MENKNQRLVNNTIIFMIGNIGSKFIQFLLVPLYTYTLTTSEYGVTELVLTAANLLMPIFSISIADGLLRFGLDKKLDCNSVLKNSMIIVFSGSILSIICIPLYSVNTILKDWIVYFLLILNLRTYRDVLAIFLKIKDKNRLFAIDSMLYTFELCGLSIVFLVWLNMGIAGYFMAYVVSNAFSLVFLLVIGHHIDALKRGSIDKKIIIDLIKYSVPMILNGIAWWVTNASDRFMLQWLMTESDVGIYSVAAKLPSFITTFTGVFNQAWIISSVIEYDNENEKRFYSKTFHRYYVILFIGAACLLSIIKPFMRVYVSQDYYIAWKYAIFLICSAIVSGIAAFTAGIYSATKKNINVMLTTLAGAVANIILNLILIPRIGIMGAAIATYVSWAVIAITRICDIRKFFVFHIEYNNLLLYSVLTLLQCVSMVYWGYLGYIISAVTIMVIVFKERKMLGNVLVQLKRRLQR